MNELVGRAWDPWPTRQPTLLAPRRCTEKSFHPNSPVDPCTQAVVTSAQVGQEPSDFSDYVSHTSSHRKPFRVLYLPAAGCTMHPSIHQNAALRKEAEDVTVLLEWHTAYQLTSFPLMPDQSSMNPSHIIEAQLRIASHATHIATSGEGMPRLALLKCNALFSCRSFTHTLANAQHLATTPPCMKGGGALIHTAAAPTRHTSAQHHAAAPHLVEEKACRYPLLHIKKAEHLLPAPPTSKCRGC